MRLTFIILISLVLTACGSGGGDQNSDLGSTVTEFSLQCDLRSSYTAAIAPDTSSATSTYVATVIAVHGKNGAPSRAHMQSLKNDLNAQGYDVILPWMPWHGLAWDGTMCDGISYLNELIDTEKTLGNPVILLGHSLAGSIVLSYSALTDTVKPDALTILAPGHFIHQSSVLAGAHASSIQSAKAKVAAGLGDVVATFQTYNSGPVDISTTANIYLSYHDTAQFPDIKATLPLVAEPMLWLAGASDPLTAVADDTFGIVDLIPSIPAANKYKIISGDHFTLVDNVTAELHPWYQAL
jgi:pimeloyl-ACP methyl ester carboxylesterase